MRIVVGVGGEADESTVAALAEAGAGELFVGYVPDAWAERYGFEASPNRRHRAFSQLRTREALARVVGAAAERSLPVHVTLNEHVLAPEQLGLADDIVGTALEVGARGAILADLSLGPRFAARFPGISLVASGEAPVYNRAAVDLAARLGFGRVILARESSLADLAPLAEACRAHGIELEAFLLGEWCVYNGAMCFTCHGHGTSQDFCSAHTIRSVLDMRTRTAELDRPQTDERWQKTAPEAFSTSMQAHADRCGLCALGRMQQLGIGYVKIPGRSQSALSAVRMVRRLLDGGDLSSEACKRAIDNPAFCDGSHCWHRSLQGA